MARWTPVCPACGRPCLAPVIEGNARRPQRDRWAALVARCLDGHVFPLAEVGHWVRSDS